MLIFKNRNAANRRLFRKLSIAFEFGVARRWKRRHPEFSETSVRPTVGVMAKPDKNESAAANVPFRVV